ncbi:MAG TPA: ATP-binding protein [Dissulfurispiraceae bacterium]|nr:ATP-binding protein [Dissulfurispiraceae bacterium]
MPFNCIPAKDFVNRRSEVLYLKRLAGLREKHVLGNILLEGANGSGKTELLKQVYRSIYWEDSNVVPFYYSFKTATLKASIFAQDYISQFIRQYLSFFSKDPSLVIGQGLSPARAIPPSAAWLLDLMDEFEELRKAGDFYGQLLAAVSAPAHAATLSGKPVLIMLDNFQMALRLYETTPGDFSGLAGFFESPMKMNLCPHIVTGTPTETLESVFAENAFRGTAERMLLSPLPDDVAYALFQSHCDKLGIKEDPEASIRFVRFLACNPLYIKCIARSIWRMGKKEASHRDLWESYSHEVSEGEISLYWSSILSEAIREPGIQRLAVRLFMHLAEATGEVAATGRLPRILGVAESEIKEALAALKSAGFLKGTTGYKVPKEPVLRDFMHSLYMQDIESKPTEQLRTLIRAKYSDQVTPDTCFEVILPSIADAELIAAKAFEQIAQTLKLQPEVTERIQLALIEACINAMEHSGSFERKVFLKFCASGERLEIAVESSGRFFDPEAVEDPEIEGKLTSANKRGWGLKLIQSIMDEVRIERIEDRTRVLLIKNIKKEEVLHDTRKL